MRRFCGFDQNHLILLSRHEQESPVYDHVFNGLPLYVHVPLYLKKKPASTSLMPLAFEFP